MMAALRKAWLSLLFLAGAVLLLVMTFSLNPTARLVPAWVAMAAVSLLLLQACLDLFPNLSRAISRFERLRLRKVETLRDQAAASTPEESEALVPVLAWYAAAPVLISLLGFTLATPIYTIAFLRFRAGETWKRSAAVGAAVSIVIALLLFLAVGRPVIDGLLIGWALGLRGT